MIIKTEITKILKDCQLYIRETLENGEYHRRVVKPIDDVSTQDKIIKDKALELFTPEVIEKFNLEIKKKRD